VADFEVPSEYDGHRLDHFLVSVLADHSRSQVQKLVAAGHVLVQRGSKSPEPVTRANVAMHAGDRVSVTIPEPLPSAVAAEEVPLDILYQDADLAVINKPAGLVVHPGAGHASGTLVNALLHHVRDLSGIGGELRPGIVHRLDRGTSGVMVIAKNDAAHQDLTRQFHDREVEKEYIALVWGVVQAGRRIDAAIGRDESNRQKMSARAKHARTAVTRITRAHHMPGLTLCQVAIHTGRTHQIRVHAQYAGHPLAGDDKYGDPEVNKRLRDQAGLRRLFLHAASLEFALDAGRTPYVLSAPLPPDLLAVLDRLA
jgi:23S rRNA pseudouridine1911/1915/1917 synthase